MPQVTVTSVSTGSINGNILDITHSVAIGDKLFIGILLQTTNAAEEVLSVTWDQGGLDEKSLVKFAEFSPSHGGLRLEVWETEAPFPKTATVRIVLEGGNSQRIGATCVSVANAEDQPGVPLILAGAVTQEGTAALATLSVTQNNDDLAFCFVGHDSNKDFAASGGETEHANFTIINQLQMWAASEDGTGATNLDWTQDQSKDYSILGFVVKASLVKLASASNTLALLTQAVGSSIILESASNSLVLSDASFNERLLSLSASSILVLSDNSTNTGPILVSANNTLNLTQNTVSIIKAGIASNTIALAQSVDVQKPIPVSAINSWLVPEDGSLPLRDSVTVAIVYNKSITSTISFGQEASKAIFVSASNHVQLSHEARSIEFESVLQVLQVTHSVSVDVVHNPNNTLALTQIATTDGIFVRSLTNTLNLNQSLTFYKTPPDLCNYLPGVGAGPAAPSMVPPTLVRRKTILLTYPYPISTLTIELRNPQFDDNEQLEFRRINRLTRGLTRKVFRDSAWPSSERLIYSFDNLKATKVAEWFSFITASLGKEIGLLDYESRQWRGIILTPEAPTNNEDRPGFDFTLEFEGVKDPGGLSVAVLGTGALVGNVLDIGPGLVAALTGSGTLVGNVERI